jgi:hypothetical protein
MWKREGSETKSLLRSDRRRALRVIVDRRRDYEDFLERLFGSVSATLRQTTQAPLLPFPKGVTLAALAVGAWNE